MGGFCCSIISTNPIPAPGNRFHPHAHPRRRADLPPTKRLSSPPQQNQHEARAIHTALARPSLKEAFTLFVLSPSLSSLDLHASHLPTTPTKSTHSTQFHEFWTECGISWHERHWMDWIMIILDCQYRWIGLLDYCWIGWGQRTGDFVSAQPGTISFFETSSGRSTNIPEENTR